MPIPLRPDLMQGAEIHLHQHRDDHHPDQQADRNGHPRHFHPADGLEQSREDLAKCDTGDNANGNPDRQVALD
jgi:hypothetical protein